MTRVMYDSVTLDAIPADARAVAGYLPPSSWPTYRQLKGRWPHADRLSIAVASTVDADCLDIETGDSTPQLAPGWVKRQHARGLRRPVVYASRDVMPAVIHELRAAGISIDQVRVWTAHYGLGPHICSPRSCGAAFTADGTQWTDRALGRNLDESLLNDMFFPSAPKHRRKRRLPRPKPVHKKAAGATIAGAIVTGLLAIAHAAGAHLTPAEAGGINAIAAIIGATLAHDGYIKRADASSR